MWKMKSNQARGVDDEDQGFGEGCNDVKDEEVTKLRMQEYEENPNMELSGKEMQIVMECDECGPSMTEYLLSDCDECGTSWVREDYTLSVIGNDVISLFPSLDSVNTGKIVREEVEKSTIKIEGFNEKLGLRYIVMNEEYTGDLGPIEELLPTRVTKPGVKPGMKSKWVNCKEILEDKDWIYPPMRPTEKQRRQIIGRVAEIGTRVIFENFVYRFGGDAYHQQAGGPIGARITMCAAKMVMQNWSEKYLGILLRANLRIPLLTEKKKMWKE